jgi:hypothetical protein
MDKRIKYLWLEALTSGEYEQGKFQLKSENKFCCLGVLCDIHRKETGLGSWERNLYSVNKKYSIFVLSNVVTKWAALDSSNPEIGDISLATLNDSGLSFVDIAKEIEKSL